MLEPSPLNRTVHDLRRSYIEGQKLATLHNMYDYETLVQQLKSSPEELQRFESNAPDKVLMRSMWHAMFFSGMMPLEHWDRPIVEASAAGQGVACVDMPESQQAELAEYVLPQHALVTAGCTCRVCAATSCLWPWLLAAHVLPVALPCLAASSCIGRQDVADLPSYAHRQCCDCPPALVSAKLSGRAVCSEPCFSIRKIWEQDINVLPDQMPTSQASNYFSAFEADSFVRVSIRESNPPVLWAASDLEATCRQLMEAMEGTDAQEAEADKFLQIMLEVGKKNLPVNLPDDLWDIMAPTMLHPGQMEPLYEELERTVPCTWEMMVRRHLELPSARMVANGSRMRRHLLSSAASAFQQ